MSIEFRYDGILLPYQTVRLTGGSLPGGVAGLPASAVGGEPMTAGVQIEDPAGVLDFDGWHTFTVDETACSAPRIFTGWITGKRISRGSYRTVAGCIWDCDIIDQNAIFSLMAYVGVDAKRPAETDLARVTFALADATVSWGLHDNGLANLTDNPRNFGESDYRHQFPAELFMSLAGAAKNFYAYWDDSAEEISLFYDLPTAAVRISTLSISNDLDDWNGTTIFAPSLDAELLLDPSDQYSRIHYGFVDNWIVRARPATSAPWSFPHRDQVYSSSRVGLPATAEAQAALFLEDHKNERLSITFMVQLPAAQVNLLHAGMLFDAKFTHLPGFTSFDSLRAIRRNVIPTANQTDLYDVHIEASLDALSRSPGGGGVIPDGSIFPHRPPNVAHWWEGSGIIQGDHFDVDAANVMSGFVVGTRYFFEVSVTNTGVVPNNTYATLVGPTLDPTTFLASSLKSSDASDVSDVPDNVRWRNDNVGASVETYAGYFVVQADSAYDEGTVWYFGGSTADGDHSGDHNSGYAFWIDPEDWEGPQPPAPGQPVDGETVGSGDGSTVTFTTAFPYADGSLRVWVDGVPILNGLTETDPATGSFTLDFAPLGASGDTRAEIVTVSYLGR